MFNRNLKNVVVVSVGFLSLFTAYGSLQSLQVSWVHKLTQTDGGFIHGTAEIKVICWTTDNPKVGKTATQTHANIIVSTIPPALLAPEHEKVIIFATF